MNMWAMKGLMADSIMKINSAYKDTDQYKFGTAKIELIEAVNNLQKVINEIKNNRTDNEDDLCEMFIDEDWGDRE